MEQYLPQEPWEPDAAYRGRLQRAAFVDRFRSDLAAKAGLLTDFTLRELPPTLEWFHSDVDRRGTNLTQFLLEADQLTLRDGGCWILVEAPPQDTPRSRPYRVLLSREQVGRQHTTLDADGEAIAQYINLYRVGLLSRPSTLEVLRRAGWLASDFDIDAELLRPIHPPQSDAAASR